MALIDFKKAFPTITIEYLLACLREAGIPPSALSVVLRLHQDESGEMVQILQGSEDASRQGIKGEWLCSQHMEPPALPEGQTKPMQQPGEDCAGEKERKAPPLLRRPSYHRRRPVRWQPEACPRGR